MSIKKKAKIQKRQRFQEKQRQESIYELLKKEAMFPRKAEVSE